MAVSWPSEHDRRDVEPAELIRESRPRRLEAEGLPFLEPPPSPPNTMGDVCALPRHSVPRATKADGSNAHEGTAMKSTLLTRLKRLETVRAVEESNRPLKFEFAYLKLLAREYHGLRHRVKVGRLPDGNYRWEERPGQAPANEDEDYSKTIIRINLVEAKHGSCGASAGLKIFCACPGTTDCRLTI